MPKVRHRPRPTRELLRELTGCNEELIGAMHHGLVETPLYDFYPDLNLSEVLMFAAASFEHRRANPDYVKKEIEDMNAYDLFSWVYRRSLRIMGARRGTRNYQNAFHWLNTHKSENLNGLSHVPLEERTEAEMQAMPPLQRKYARVNPYNPRTLQQRLAEVPDLTLEALRKGLGKRTLNYVSKGRFAYMIRDDRLQPAAKRRIVAMGFQPSSFKGKGSQIAPRYAEEVVRILADYPKCYTPLPKSDS